MTPRRAKDVQLEDHLPADQAILFSALREEFDAKMSSLKAWGIAALVGGQVAAGIVTAYIGPSSAAHAAIGLAKHLV